MYAQSVNVRVEDCMLGTVVLVADCEISNILQAQFRVLHHAQSHEGHAGNEESQEGSGRTSPSDEGHEGHEVNRLAAKILSGTSHYTTMKAVEA